METAHWLRTRRRRFFVIPISGKSYYHCKLISCVCSTGTELPALAFISQLTLVLNKLSNTEKSMFSRQLKTLEDIDLSSSKIWWELIKFFDFSNSYFPHFTRVLEIADRVQILLRSGPSLRTPLLAPRRLQEVKNMCLFFFLLVLGVFLFLNLCVV